jgi:hypothetical protein
LEDRKSLLERLVRFELPIEDSIAILRILERYLAGELSAQQVEYWVELLEMSDDVGSRSAGRPNSVA